VTALHEIPVGEAWPLESILARQSIVRKAGMDWTVVESLDTSERMKMQSAGWQRDAENYAKSIRNLAAAGIRVIAYNWMPLFSWMRTHLHEPAPTGGHTTRFDALAFAAFDMYMLKRPGAEAEWGAEISAAARECVNQLSAAQSEILSATVLHGLPGGHQSLTLEGARELLNAYSGMTADDLRGTLREFANLMCPIAEECDVKLCVHPDDPPRPLLGLPRVVSTAADLRWILDQYDSDANSLTFCTGALGVRPDNDLLTMARDFAPRIGFLHLRSTKRETTLLPIPIETFFEDTHLDGDADLVRLIPELVKEKRRRQRLGDTRSLPFRADHGQELLNDYERGGAPGYPAIGRLRGLAELRGAFTMAERLVTNTH
jgi:mannonate dehydratase